MIAPETRTRPALLTGAACLVIVVAGLRAAGDILVQVLLALFIAIVCYPVQSALRRRGLPTFVAVLGVVALVLILLFALVWIVAGAVAEFSAASERYEERLSSLVADAAGTAEALGLDLGEESVEGLLDTGTVFRFARSVAGSATATLSSVLVVVFIVVFMLLEAGGIPEKLRRASGDPEADMASFRAMLDQVHRYLAVKTAVGLATGVLVGILCALMGVDFAVLWGLTAFLLNFIPNVGSILAAAPAVLVALVQLGAGPAAGLAAGYLAINMTMGNVIEPRLTGASLGLSPLVVIVSLIFWSWLWGPVGMLLSVPLTTVVKICLESREDLRPIAVLLGPADDGSG
jgi:AI-2 transport protein TqsA